MGFLFGLPFLSSSSVFLSLSFSSPSLCSSSHGESQHSRMERALHIDRSFTFSLSMQTPRLSSPRGRFVELSKGSRACQ